ncbi:unnamed protein product [Bemisia tabaci]|uniref:Uncharacterized protein n=1 Tax=Bemisia tabaci TaxID=7038 RepID=A0A9P0AFX6_BEMTA|nr:unnamed protein product [Bemisia tabaci]
MAEITGRILRGTLWIPRLIRAEPVLLHVAAKLVGDKWTIFRPAFITENSQLSPKNCEQEWDTYFCTEVHLTPTKLEPLYDTYVYEHGIVVINEHQIANSKTAENSTLTKVIGPAVCSSSESALVVIENDDGDEAY